MIRSTVIAHATWLSRSPTPIKVRRLMTTLPLAIPAAAVSDAPRAYLDSNIVGSFNVMEAARRLGVQHLLMASTSSVYGANTQMPYAETDKADTQMSFYAATKKANEAMAHSYAHLYGLPVNWAAVNQADGRFVRLPAYPWQRQSYWLDSGTRHRHDPEPQPHPLLPRRWLLLR